MKKVPQAKKQSYLICLFLILATLAVYWQVSGFDFINIDDEYYIYHNWHIQSGITFRSISWAFTSSYAGNWHPLTWISHMLDWQLFGPSAGSHHLVNVLLHVASTLLLFLILNKLTTSPRRSALVALLFAIHPLHVESVAWLAERKDVLSAFFWMLSILAYINYARSPGVKRYLLVALVFALGLLAKPMVVTLPIILLLLDYWPLARRDKSWSKLALEKTPLLALSAVSSVLTMWAQNRGLAVGSLEAVPLGVRAANAAVASVSYIIKMISPLNLAIFYPHPYNTLPVWQVICSTLALMIVTACAVWQARKRPYILAGWLWYLVTLIPVIGLVQVGLQAMADRYTYIPLIGLFVIIAWGLSDISVLRDMLADRGSAMRGIGTAGGVAVLLGFAVLTYFQVGYWRDNISLTQHAISVTDGNYFAHNSLGSALVQKDRVKEGIVEYLTAIKIYPDFAEPHNNLGIALAKIKSFDAAIFQFKQAARLSPQHAEIFNNLGATYAQQHRYKEASNAFKTALKIEPEHFEAHMNLGYLMARQREYAGAATYFSEALNINPDSMIARRAFEKASALTGNNM